MNSLSFHLLFGTSLSLQENQLKTLFPPPSHLFYISFLSKQEKKRKKDPLSSSRQLALPTNKINFLYFSLFLRPSQPAPTARFSSPPFSKKMPNPYYHISWPSYSQIGTDHSMGEETANMAFCMVQGLRPSGEKTG